MKIHALDLHFQDVSHAIAAYLVEGPEGYLLIETGPMSTLRALQERLAEHGLSPADIHDIAVTHIHLDHAGAAGWWAQQGARIYVHQAGAAHLVDPRRLWQSASRIYGDSMEPLWGSVLPAPAEQVITVHDGEQIEAGGLSLIAIDTPGHAGHHHTYRLGDVAFTGDATGVRIAGSDWVSLPAPPPEFNRELWWETLNRLEAEGFSALYPTHFGRVEDVDYQFAEIRSILEDASTFVRARMEEGMERDDLINAYTGWNRERALGRGMEPEDFARYEAANPLFMSVDGLMRYWLKQAEAASGSA
ncbi:MAG: MBL fold metallo-hydrolase [Anaerolineae bacterium]|nr:MBL fold metallo-hydrolase [Anaerolineae bacterium]